MIPTHHPCAPLTQEDTRQICANPISFTEREEWAYLPNMVFLEFFSMVGVQTSQGMVIVFMEFPTLPQRG